MTDVQQRFFERLDQLGTGGRAALRRSAGTMLREADGQALSAFYRCLPSVVEERDAAKWFAVACLRCCWDAGGTEGKALEQVISELIRRADLSESSRHRVELLLDTRWDNDGYLLTKLARLIKLVRQKSDREKLDFSSLLDDLLRWNYESQSVQRKWVRAIFGNDNDEERE